MKYWPEVQTSKERAWSITGLGLEMEARTRQLGEISSLLLFRIQGLDLGQ